MRSFFLSDRLGVGAGVPPRGALAPPRSALYPPLERVLHLVHPRLEGLEPHAHAGLVAILDAVVDHIVCAARAASAHVAPGAGGPQQRVGSGDVDTVMWALLGGEGSALARFGRLEGMRAIEQAWPRELDGEVLPSAAACGLSLSPATLAEALAAGGGPSLAFTPGAAVFAAASLEYLAAECLELAGDRAARWRHAQVSLSDLWEALHGDAQLWAAVAGAWRLGEGEAAGGVALGALGARARLAKGGRPSLSAPSPGSPGRAPPGSPQGPPGSPQGPPGSPRGLLSTAAGLSARAAAALAEGPQEGEGAAPGEEVPGGAGARAQAASLAALRAARAGVRGGEEAMRRAEAAARAAAATLREAEALLAARERALEADIQALQEATRAAREEAVGGAGQGRLGF